MEIEKAYKISVEFAKSHYENFPVISFFIPERLRAHISIIYWFARTADDLADEGNFSPEYRIKQLDDFKLRFLRTLSGDYSDSFDQALGHTISQFNLSSSLFLDLLSAFRQDVSVKRYSSYQDLLDYCRRSANPVGRLILQLYGIRDAEAFIYSDSICTALQLTNFYQDLAIDYQKGRIYIPLDELIQFNVEEPEFGAHSTSDNLKALLHFNISRNSLLYSEGRKLLAFLPAGLRQEIKWTISGGEEILRKIIINDFRVLEKRPKLYKFDFIKLFFRSIT